MNLFLIDKKVDNGVYIEGYLSNSNSFIAENIIYKCYLPYTGKVAKIPEMSRYFFYDTIRKYNIGSIYLLTQIAEKFIHDEVSKEDVFQENNYFYKKVY